MSVGLRGTVSFESHTNLGTADDGILSGPMEHMSLGGDAGAASTSASARETPARPRRKARGKGNRADQFCIYRTSDGQGTPTLAIEYKAPHKLMADEVVSGLQSEIQPKRDVINKNGDGFVFTARALAAAVITQLFSYMVGKGIQYGYVCTGECFVFLHIPDDPSVVYYSVYVPNRDVMDDDETRLHRTAVAQVFAFTLQALRASPPPQSWHDQAERLETWAVEYDDILRNIPATERKKVPRDSPYKPQRWKGFTRSPIRLRPRCRPRDVNAQPKDLDEDPPSPTPNASRTGKSTVALAGTTADARQQGRRGRQGQATKPDIQSRPFCTHQCLLGLAYGGPMDGSCPNLKQHGRGHLNRQDFLRLIRDQLAKDRGHDADCVPLNLSGSRGSLFKVRLSSHGYTLVAKGMERLDHRHLQHENDIYNKLRTLQGRGVPVSLGIIDLILPYYYNSGVYEYFIFFSWAGWPLSQCDKVKAGAVNAVTAILKRIHDLGVLHCDAEPRNILYDGNNFMVIDFERAKFCARQPLRSIGTNEQNQTRKRRPKQKDEFARELESAVEKVSRYVTEA
ncbi:hypothetical protein VUR80DRAFT_3119 [Thermomyces stellatus]